VVANERKLIQMEFKVLGFTDAAGGAPELALDALDDAVRQVGAEPVRHWRVDDRRYVVIEGSPDIGELHGSVEELSVDLIGIGRTELSAPAAELLPMNVSFDPFSAVSDPVPNFTLNRCMGCGVELPAAAVEHAKRSCPLAGLA
jgi:hypothetical protein